jgi:uncharacterized protein (TIGR02996 family)
MTDHDALIRAICEYPDDDTPRLIFADYLEENGDAERAAFVRAQVELARTPAWEPFAALCRHRRTDWFDGAPWRHTLLPLELPGLEWAPVAFRRGFGWRVQVTSPLAWAEVAPRVCRQAPVGDLSLNTSATTRDDLRRLAAGDWVRCLRVVHLDGASPVEPIRVLCGTPAATGITDVHFHRASSPGLPLLIEDLMQTPLGRALRGLHFHVGYEALEHLIDALSAGGESTRLERLGFVTMGLTAELVGRLLRGPAARHLTELDLRNNLFRTFYQHVRGLDEFLPALPPRVHTLGLAHTDPNQPGLEALAGCDRVVSLRRLDLSRNPVTPGAVKALARSPHLTGLRSLDLRGCGIGAAQLRHLVRANFWPTLVELDLRKNPIKDGNARRLLDTPVPADLTALLIDGSNLTESVRGELRRHYGERLVLSEVAE